ncbi:MAG: hypothetical protein ACREOO_29070 [bacterium]
MNLRVSASAERFTAHLDLAWRHSYFASGPLPEGDGVEVQANLQDQTWGGGLAVAVQWHFAGSLALLAGARYRFAQFDALVGPASYSDSNIDNGPFIAELVEAPNYLRFSTNTSRRRFSSRTRSMFCTSPLNITMAPRAREVAWLLCRRSCRAKSCGAFHVPRGFPTPRWTS